MWFVLDIVCYKQTGCTTVICGNSSCSWFLITWYNTCDVCRWLVPSNLSGCSFLTYFPTAQIHSILVCISIKIFHISKNSILETVFYCNFKSLWHLKVCLFLYTPVHVTKLTTANVCQTYLLLFVSHAAMDMLISLHVCIFLYRLQKEDWWQSFLPATGSLDSRESLHISLKQSNGPELVATHYYQMKKYFLGSSSPTLLWGLIGSTQLSYIKTLNFWTALKIWLCFDLFIP